MKTVRFDAMIAKDLESYKRDWTRSELKYLWQLQKIFDKAKKQAGAEGLKMIGADLIYRCAFSHDVDYQRITARMFKDIIDIIIDHTCLSPSAKLDIYNHYIDTHTSLSDCFGFNNHTRVAYLFSGIVKLETHVEHHILTTARFDSQFGQMNKLLRLTP
jgi:hypothetical protein